MKEELIKYNTAKLADEKGFRFGCKYVINEDNEVNSSLEYTGNPYFTHEETIKATDNTEVPHYLCPTQSLLQKWLRDNYNILVYCFPYDNGWYYQITTFYDDDCITQFNEGTIQTYEEALEHGLYESLKLINNEE